MAATGTIRPLPEKVTCNTHAGPEEMAETEGFHTAASASLAPIADEQRAAEVDRHVMCHWLCGCRRGEIGGKDQSSLWCTDRHDLKPHPIGPESVVGKAGSMTSGRGASRWPGELGELSGSKSVPYAHDSICGHPRQYRHVVAQVSFGWLQTVAR